MELIYGGTYVLKDSKEGVVHMIDNITDEGAITCIKKNGEKTVHCARDFYALYKAV
jgi:hypothetical protein